MTHKEENPSVQQHVGVSKTFEPSQVEHLISSPSSKAKQGVSDNIIGGAHA